MNQAKFFLFSLFFLAFQANSQAQTKHYYQIAGGLGAARGQYLNGGSAFGKSYNTLGGRFGVLYVNQKEGSFTYKTGLNFSVFGEKFDLSNAQWGSQHNGNGGFDPNLPSGESVLYFTQNYYFLEAPFLFHFDFRQNTKWTPYGEIGLAGNVLLGGKNNLFGTQSVFLPSAIANLGLQYEYKPNQFIFVQPSFTAATTKLNRKIQIHSNMYLFNVEIGARYAL
jgi:hypothetical protein